MSDTIKPTPATEWDFDNEDDRAFAMEAKLSTTHHPRP